MSKYMYRGPTGPQVPTLFRPLYYNTLCNFLFICTYYFRNYSGVIEPVAQMFTPLSANLSLSAWWQLNKRCYIRFSRLPIGRLPIGYRLIHIRRPYKYIFDIFLLNHTRYTMIFSEWSPITGNGGGGA